jgi:protein CpxP
MKKIIMTILAGAFTAIAVSAQEIPERKDEGYKPHAKSRMHGKRSMANLNLTEDQKAQFKTLNMEHRKQMEELKKQDNITVKESRERIEKLRKEHKEKFQSILTTTQKEQMQKNREEQKASREKMARKGGDRMKAELGLTDEQSAQLQKQRKETGEQMKAIRENSSLSDEQKKEQMKALHKKQQDAMKSVLTEEQIKKLKERKGKREGDRKGKPSMKKETI